MGKRITYPVAEGNGWCSRCQKELPASAFHKSAPKRGRIRGYCRICMRAYYRAKNLSTPGYQAGMLRAVRQRKYMEVAREKVRRGCARCGERHPACLDFHHRDRTTKDLTLSQMCARAASDRRIQEEIQKCDLLCANCHRKLHWGDRGLLAEVFPVE